MEEQGGIKQPMLGILATIIVFVLSLGIIAWFKTETFLTWVGYLAMTVIPIQVIVGLAWQHNYPPPAAKMEQPLKGVYLLLFTFLVGTIVASLSHFTIGGFVSPPTPFVIFFTILSVVLSLWLVIVWQCWPMSAIHPHPAFVGFGTLILVYVLDIIIYKSLMDFSFLKGAPFYKAVLDPAGPVNAWALIGYAVSTVAVILAMAELDFWPLSLIPAKDPAWGKMPLFGILATVWILVIAFILRSICVGGFGMDPVVYAVRVPICMIFGEFIMLLLMQTAPFQTVKQPAKGFFLIIISILLAMLMYYLYTWFSYLIAGGVPSGPPQYLHELWIATALLSITFPVIAVYSGLFNFWPLSEPMPKKD
jgi:hypothetical protein